MVLRNPVLQRLPFQQLHGDERLTFVLTDIVDRVDIGMIERGGCLGFAPEALERLTVVSERLRKKLECYVAV